MRKALATMLMVAMFVLVACGSGPNVDEGAGSAAGDTGSGADAYGNGGGDAGGAPGAVKVVDFAFSPPQMKVAVGQTVTWTFADEAGHTATSTDGTFKSEVLGSGGTYSFTFTRAGTFDYFCTIHPDMKGKIIVG
jgi:plastocyanin